MASNFIFLFYQLNLLSFSEKKKKEMINKMGLTIMEAIELFEYKKSNEGYWNRFKLDKQVVNKILSITEALYQGYLLVFLFYNMTSHSVFAQNALCTIQMN